MLLFIIYIHVCMQLECTWYMHNYVFFLQMTRSHGFWFVYCENGEDASDVSYALPTTHTHINTHTCAHNTHAHTHMHTYTHAASKMTNSAWYCLHNGWLFWHNPSKLPVVENKPLPVLFSLCFWQKSWYDGRVRVQNSSSASFSASNLCCTSVIISWA